MATYDELKDELSKIASILKQFPAEVQPRVFELLVSSYLDSTASISSQPAASASQTRRAKPKAGKKKSPSKKKTAKRGKKAAGTRESYRINRDLNLRGDKSIPAFKNFYGDKAPTSAREFNTVAVYYLKKLLGHANVTLDDIYTCYKEVGKKPPAAFRQSFTDTKNKVGWIEFEEDGSLSIPHRGAVYVEHDLPKGP